MNRLYLVRHADVVVSEDVPAREWPLSEPGRRAAERLGTSPLWCDIALVATGPEPKMVATAEPIAAAAGIAPRRETDLREVDRAATWTVGADRYRGLVRRFFAGDHLPGWEERDAARARVAGCVERLLEATPGPLVVVSGGLALTLYVTSLAGAPPATQVWTGIPLPAVAVVDPAAGRIVSGFQRLETFLATASATMAASEPKVVTAEEER